ncbi:MAG: RsmE family RNA methyltransferase [Bacteroidota bacterium]|nr:RsmE family RNA methyltransferase [Bacteroidota bacterium]
MNELFFKKDLSEKINEFSLELEESKHILKSLRKKEGDYLTFTNGKGFKFNTILGKFSSKKYTLKILNFERIDNKENLHIAISVLKSPSRFENFLEKVTEIGVSEISPIICERTVKKNLNFERCKRILISAMKQSYKFKLPHFNKIQDFNSFMKARDENVKLLATCEALDKNKLIESFSKNQKNLIMIGPEGDFTKNEIENAINHNFKLVSLGKNRLRAETAGIYSCAVFSMIK